MSLTNRGHSRSGFSLIEVLVALAVASLMVAMLVRFYAGTRATGSLIGEAMDMETLSESLVARVFSQKMQPGRTDGRSGKYAWRIEVMEVPFQAQARIRREKKQDKKQPDQKSSKMLSTLSLESSFNVPKPGAEQEQPAKIKLLPYRVAITVTAPSGRTYETDTFRVGHARPN